MKSPSKFKLIAVALLTVALGALAVPLIPMLPDLPGALAHLKPQLPAIIGALGAVPLCGFTAADIDEFRKSLTEINGGVSEMRTGLKSVRGELDPLKKSNDDLAKALAEIDKENKELKKHLDVLRKARIDDLNQRQLSLRPGQAVTDDCAKFLGALCVQGAEIHGKLSKHPNRDNLLNEAARTLGLEQRAALTSTDIPMPVNYVAQVVELVFKYGTIRQRATVYPLGTLTTKLPKLSTDPAFGLIAQSATVTEKSPQVAFVTFTATKSGGLIRIPTEIEADSIVNLGQFLARYIARQMAKWEDTWGFMADGTATYNSQNGIAKQADTNGFKLQLAATNSDSTKITLANMRTLRSKPNGATLGSAAYYMHPTGESQMVTFNTSATVTPYIVRPDGTASLDGFPIIWTPVMPVFDGVAHLNQYQVVFGDASYWYFGERYGLDVQVSRDVFFATDEIAMRALERFDQQLMAADALAVLQLSAS